MMFIGIDPGLKGGISIIDSETNNLFISKEMPLNEDNKSINCKEIFQELCFYWHRQQGDVICFCVIEQLQTMPGQNVKATSSSAVNYGKLLAILELLEIPYQEVHPLKWKKAFQLVKKSKYESTAVAKSLFPKEHFMTERGRLMDGKAESLLMAEYARRIHKGE